MFEYYDTVTVTALQIGICHLTVSNSGVPLIIAALKLFISSIEKPISSATVLRRRALGF